MDRKSLLLRVTKSVGCSAGVSIAVCDTITGLIDHISVALEEGAFGWHA